MILNLVALFPPSFSPIRATPTHFRPKFQASIGQVSRSKPSVLPYMTMHLHWLRALESWLVKSDNVHCTLLQ